MAVSKGRSRSFKTISSITDESRLSGTKRMQRYSTGQYANETQGVIQALVKTLVEEYEPEKIFLFGSYAYGQPDMGSDLDLLLVKDSREEPAERKGRVGRIVAPLRRQIGVDVFVLTPAELEVELRNGNQFYQEVVSRGVLLYGVEESYPMVDDSAPYARAWLSVALEDLQAAELLLEHEGPAAAAGMLLQQALEKYLKAYLLFRGWRLQRTHNLVELLDEAVKHDQSLEEYRPICDAVTSYYVEDRYPDAGRRDLTRDEVGTFLERVRPLIRNIVDTSPM